MSKGSKSRSKARRKAAKVARKAAQRALYESYRDHGDNSKRKRRLSARRGTVRSVRHETSHCGNIGCKRCYPGLRRAG